MAQIVLLRHGQTEWSANGRHTSYTDLDLTPRGVEQAGALAAGLRERPFTAVLTSPRLRATRTAALAGLAATDVTEDLAEWHYGDYEGVTTPESRRSVPGWTVWTHGCPSGETAEQVTTRLDRVVERVRGADGDVLVFGHGHALRALAARWLGLPVSEGRLLKLDTATVSILGYERETAVLLRWNG